MTRERVQRFLSVLIIVALARQTQAHAIRHVTHALLPDLLVETGVDADVGCAHVLGSKVANHLDGAGGLALKAVFADAGMDVDGIVASDDF